MNVQLISTANKSGPLYNSIKILDQNSSNGTIITASSWVDYSRFWFAEGAIYGQMSENQKTINEEVENYFSAFNEALAITLDGVMERKDG